MKELETLEQLYLGKIRPHEEIGANNKDLIEIRKTLLKITKDFKNCLDSPFYRNILVEFEKIEEVQGYYDALYNYESFSYGFNLAMKLLKE